MKAFVPSALSEDISFIDWFFIMDYHCSRMRGDFSYFASLYKKFQRTITFIFIFFEIFEVINDNGQLQFHLKKHSSTLKCQETQNGDNNGGRCSQTGCSGNSKVVACVDCPV